MFTCQHCKTRFKQPFAGPCPDCGGNQLNVNPPMPGPSEEKMAANLERYRENQRMNNLEFMAAYQVEKLNISDLSAEQLVHFRAEKVKNITRERIQIQAAEHRLRELGQAVQMQLTEEDMKYIPPANVQLDAMEKKLSKKGETAEKIKAIKNVVDSLDFSDI